MDMTRACHRMARWNFLRKKLLCMARIVRLLNTNMKTTHVNNVRRDMNRLLCMVSIRVRLNLTRIINKMDQKQYIFIKIFLILRSFKLKI